MPVSCKSPLSLASFKSRLVLPFWYRHTQVVMEKRLLNRCGSSSLFFISLGHFVLVLFAFVVFG